MFGYLFITKELLTLPEKKIFRNYFCALCLAHQYRYGKLSAYFNNYDMGVFAIVLVVGYLLGSDQQMASNPEISSTTLKLVDSGLKAAYIFLGLAIIGVLFSELSSIFR